MANDVQAEVAASQDEGRNYSSELFRLKAAQDEAVEQLDIVKRENKNLADEIKDLLDQLGEGGRSIHDLDKQRRRLETEKEELQSALEEAEATLEMEENKVLRAQLELAQVKQEIDRRVAEKEDEFNNTRKNHARAMDSIGASIETEQRAKGEALRVKKQLEGEINELEIGLDHANKANSEGLSPLSVIKDNSEKPSSYLKMRLVPKPRLLNKSESLSAKLHLFLEKLRRAKPFWMVPTVLNANWSPPSTPCKLKLMACLLQQRMQKRNPRRPWWTLHALLMSLEPSRTMQILWVLQRTLLETNLESLKVALPMPRMLL